MLNFPPLDNISGLVPLEDLPTTELVPYDEDNPAPLDSDPVKARIMKLAVKTAPSVLSLRAWDEFGTELAACGGAFVNERGLVLTDISIVHPSISRKIAYITARTADGHSHRVLGVTTYDIDQGLTLLQTDATKTAKLEIFPQEKIGEKGLPVSLLGLNESRGLVLADAILTRDNSVVGAGWLRLTGKDSPVAPGSPVLDGKGHILAVANMRVQMKEWFSFAASVAPLKGMLAAKQDKLLAFSQVTGPGMDSLSTEPKLVEVVQFLQVGKATAAVHLLLPLLKKYPRSAELWSMLGLAAAKLGDAKEALACQQRAAALDPSVGVAWRQMALQTLGIGQGSKSSTRELLENTVSRLPRDEQSWFLLGLAYLREGNPSKASDAFLQSTSINPNAARNFLYLGHARALSKDWSGAEISLRRCVEVAKQDAAAWLTLGMVYQKTSRFKEAADCYQSAANAAPWNSRCWLHLAHLQRKLGRQPEAQAAFKRFQEAAAAGG